METANLDPRFLDWWSAVRAEVDRISENDRAEAPRFNIFQVLRSERDEVRTHSRILASLFDPHGTHGQGTRFLAALLEHHELKDFRSLADDRGWESTTEEFHGEYGRFDIVLRHSRKRQIIVIENKVDAADGDNQCGRYLAWLNKQEEGQDWTTKLIYLTPDGREAELENPETGYIALSYTDLAELLEGAIDDEVPNSVKTTVEQYLHVAKNLNTHDLGGLLNMNVSNLTDFLKQEGNHRYAFEVSSAVDGLRQQLLKEFFAAITDGLKDEITLKWTNPKEYVESDKLFVEFYRSKSDILKCSAQLYGGKLISGIGWADTHRKDDQVSEAVASLYKAAAAHWQEPEKRDPWWLISHENPMTLEDACISGPERPREVGRTLGSLALAIDKEIRAANEALLAR